MVANTIACRSILYTTPELAPWSSNGGSSINQKIIQHLKKVEKTGAAGIVEEQIVRMRKGTKVSTPKKKDGPSTPSPKKRKATVVKAEDEDDFDDY